MDHISAFKIASYQLNSLGRLGQKLPAILVFSSILMGFQNCSQFETKLPELQIRVSPLEASRLTIAAGDSSVVASQSSTELQAIIGAPISNQLQVHVADYWPRPSNGLARHNEFSYIGVDGTPIRYMVQRYVRSGEFVHLQDFRAPDGSNAWQWLSTWVLEHTAAGDVLEVADSVTDLANPSDCSSLSNPCYYLDLSKAPMNHGRVLSVGIPISSQARGESYSVPGFSALGVWNNYYSLQVKSIRNGVLLPSGVFDSVIESVEQQVIWRDNEYSSKTTLNYIFYQAPQVGIIGMRWLDENWRDKPGNPFLFLTKTCEIPETQFYCP